MDVRIAEDWKEVLRGEFDKPYFEQLTNFVRQEYAAGQVFPPRVRCWDFSLMATFLLPRVASVASISLMQHKRHWIS